MIITNKRALPLTAAIMVFIVAVLTIITRSGSDIGTYTVFDKFYTYIIVPPFAGILTLIDESINKPVIVRIGSRSRALRFEIMQQYSFAAGYLLLWFLMFTAFGIMSGASITTKGLLNRFFRYLLSFIIFVNVAGIFKRTPMKLLSSVPIVSAYIFLLLDTMVLTAITSRFGATLYLIFSWTFYRKDIPAFIALALWSVITLICLHYCNRKADIL